VNAAISSLARLPAYVHDRFQKPALLRRCQAGGATDMSAAAFYEQVRALAAGLVAMGLGRGDRVALLAESSPEWVIADLAVLSVGGVTVPIYTTLPAPQVQYIVGDSEARLAIVSTASQAAKLQEARHRLPALEAVLSIVPLDPSPTIASVQPLDRAIERGRERLTSDPAAGADLDRRAGELGSNDLATIIYTSGTTGEPKGVMLSHGNLLADLVGTATMIPPLTPADTALSFLPLSHAFERLAVMLYLYHGVTIGFAEAVDTVARDLGTIAPTVMTGVPRFYEKLHDRILESAARLPRVQSLLFRWALQAGRARARRRLSPGRRRPSPLVALAATAGDRLVLSRIRARTGGRLRYFVSGSAPLSPETAEFFYAIGLPIYEGYGLTETSPVLTVNPPDAPRVGTVGRPIPGVELSIAPDGEILARGPIVMQGYFKKPDQTAEVLRDGWLHTGDIGVIDADGYLRITDRKKELIVTAGGKKIAPAPLEIALRANPLVQEALVVGDRRRFPSALIVPNFELLTERARHLGLRVAAREELVEHPEVIGLYQEIVDALNHSLAQFERIKKIVLLPREFTIDSGELTPTMKVRRKVVEETWRETIDRLYAD
jgi:long-chain acyl-CoA synthetase